MEFVSLLSGLYIVLHKSQKFLEKPIVTVHDDIDIFTKSTAVSWSQMLFIFQKIGLLDGRLKSHI